MKHLLNVYNTYTGTLEQFRPLSSRQVTLYLCGPTVYGPAHLGHARSAIVFDIVVRYLRHIGYEVCYVRNFTDVGHLVNDADEGEDKIIKQARRAQVNPMAIAQTYSHSYRTEMAMLNVMPPTIAPCATGHITEQIAWVQALLDCKAAYVVNGSVYFDLVTYGKKYAYGTLSGRKADELRSGMRTLAQVKEKRHAHDFALWKRVAPDYLMHWPSPWGEGVPGWHLECTVMSQKYLGRQFDIHGGGLDLCFPHHECEIAQSMVVTGELPARYWLHNNLVNIAGQKMSKTTGNFITLRQCFTGEHSCLTQAYPPMLLRFFFLQAHYRSPISFSDAALAASGKGYYRLMNALNALDKLVAIPREEMATSTVSDGFTAAIAHHCQGCYDAMNEDFNTAKTIAHLFELRKYINRLYTGEVLLATLPSALWKLLYTTFRTFVQHILGLQEHVPADTKALIEALLVQYTSAKETKNYGQVQMIREQLEAQDILVHDSATGIHWSYKV